MNDANLKSIHEYLPQIGINDFDVPYEDFKFQMELPENRKAFYDYVQPQMEELGTYEDFEFQLSDPTPLDREPVEIPALDPQNQEDYVNLEKPIEDEKQNKLRPDRIEEQGFQDIKIEGLPEPEAIAQLPDNIMKKSGFTLDTWNKNVDDFNSALDNMITSVYVTGDDFETSVKPITEYFNRFRDDDDDEITGKEVAVNIAEGLVKLGAIPGEMFKEATTNPIHFGASLLEFFASAPQALGELLIASNLNPLYTLPAAAGHEPSKQRIKQAQDQVMTYPVETFIQGMVLKPAMQGGMAIMKAKPKKVLQGVKNVAENIKNLPEYTAKAYKESITDTATGIMDIATKKIVTEFKLPSVMVITKDKVRAVTGGFEGVKVSPLERQLITDILAKDGGYRKAVLEGLAVEIPIQKVVKIVDRNFWKKTKKVFGKKPTNKIISSEIIGEAKKTTQPVAGLLGESVRTKGKTKWTEDEITKIPKVEKPVVTEKPVEVKPKAEKFTKEEVSKVYSEGLESGEGSQYYMIDSDGSVIAKANIFKKDVTASGKYEIDDIFVDEKYQGQGISTKILDEISKDYSLDKSNVEMGMTVSDGGDAVANKFMGKLKEPVPTELTELKTLFEEIDPKQEIDIYERDDLVRTAQEEILDAENPQTAEGMLAQIEASGLKGKKPEEVQITGTNYQVAKDDVIVDKIKIYKGADPATVIEERSEAWFKRQSQTDPEFEKTISEERKLFEESTGEKTGDSDIEWFSTKAKENAVGGGVKGKFSKRLKAILDKFKKYAQELLKGADKFKQYVKEGKVSKRFKDLLDKSVLQKTKSVKEVGLPTYETKPLQAKKARTMGDMDVLIPEKVRMAHFKPKGKPYRHISGKSFRELDLTKTESKVEFTDKDLSLIWNKSLKESDLTIADIPKGMNPNTIDFWNKSFALNDRARFWYEISAEAFGDRLVGLSPQEQEMTYALVGATSIQANPNINVERTLSVLAEVFQGLPVQTGLSSQKPVTDALFGSLEGLKTGNFDLTFKFISGLTDKVPLSTNDRQVASTFNIDPEILASDPRIYELISKFFLNQRDVANTKIALTAHPYETWHGQALGWVRERLIKKPDSKQDDLMMALDRTLQKLVDAGIKVPKNAKGELIVTKDLLRDPKILGVLSPTRTLAVESKVGTIEAATKLTPEGKSAAELVDIMQEALPNVDKATARRFEIIINKLRAVRNRQFGALGLRRKDIPGKKSVVDLIMRAITGKSDNISRIEFGKDTYGTWGDEANPNIRIILRTGLGEKSIGLTDTVYNKDGTVKKYGQIDQFLALVSKHWHQDAAAASLFTYIEPNAKPDTRTAFIEGKDKISIESGLLIQKTLNIKSGKQFGLNVKSVPNGTVMNINPHFGEKGIEAPDLGMLRAAIKSVVGDKVNLNIFDNGYKNNYILRPVYEKILKEARDDIARRHESKLVKQGTQRQIRSTVRGREKIDSIWKGKPKSTLVKAERVRSQHRLDIDLYKKSEKYLKDSEKVATKETGQIVKESVGFVKKATGKAPKITYELKLLDPVEIKKQRIAARKKRQEKKAELAKIDAKDEAKAVPEFIRTRRTYMDQDGFDRKIFSEGIRKKTTEPEREILPYLMENTVTIPDALGRPDLQELIKNTDVREKLFKVAKELRNEFQKYWDRQVDFNEDLAPFEKENYITHIWDVPKNKKLKVNAWFTTESKFQNKRYIETLVEGIEDFGLKPKYNDVLDIFNTYAGLTTKVLANKRFINDIKSLKKGGIRLIARQDLAPDNWIEMNHPAFKYSVKTEDGATITTYNKVHPDLVDPLNIIFGASPISNFGMVYDKITGVVKKAQLSLSLFHHLALSETGLPVAGLKNTLKVLTGVPVKGFWNQEIGAWSNAKMARDGLENGLQIGATVDIPVQEISNMLHKLQTSMKDVPIANLVTRGMFKFNEKWDHALWDWLHDGFKVYAYENKVSKINLNKINTPEKMTIQKREIAQFVNDTFGGQNWDILGWHPNYVKNLGRAFLSLDWLVSTTRQALAPLAIFTAPAKYIPVYKGETKLRFVQPQYYGKKVLEILDTSITKTNQGRWKRTKMGAAFFAKAAMYYGILMNMINIVNRRADMEDHPEYYPNMKEEDKNLYNMSMFGNTIGNKTRVFVGRNKDNTEEYLRTMKQFRELPEFFYDDMGQFNPLYASTHRIGAKLAPVPQQVSQLFTGISPSGFRNYEIFEKRGSDWNQGVIKSLMRSFVPFSTQAALRKDREFKWYNIMLPSSKGMSRKRAEQFMYLGLNKGDHNMVREASIAAIQNGIDPNPILDRVLGQINQDYLYDITKHLESPEEFRKAAQKLHDEVGRPTKNYQTLMKRAVFKENEKVLLEKSYQEFLQLEKKLEKHKLQYPELYTGFKTGKDSYKNIVIPQQTDKPKKTTYSVSKITKGKY